MLFNSYEFLFVYLPIVIVGLFIVRVVRPHLCPAWLTMASIGFYAIGSLQHLWILLLSIAVNFFIGGALARTRAAGRPTTLLLWLGLGFNLGLLGYFKYAVFLVDTVAALAGASGQMQGVVLPVGISFFTFTQLAYLVDAHRGVAREYDGIRYALFVTYFPHLIAGPILHHREMMPQFQGNEAFRFDALDLAVGGSLFMIGLAKKVLLADPLAHVADNVFRYSAEVPLTIAEGWVGALAFSLQIYFDFSGYSDMALGLARMMGVRLPLNFNSPYKAGSIIEFWRRWHMTLSRFLRDYLYITLGGNRRGPLRRYLNLALTMILGGLWHGAGWTFAIWGALHGVYLIINHAWRHLHRSPPGALVRSAGALLTFLAVVVAWVFFRADNLPQAWQVLGAMTGANGLALPAPMAAILPSGWIQAGGTFANGLFEPLEALLRIGVLLLGVWVLPNAAGIMARYQPAFETISSPGRHGGVSLTWQPSTGWAVAIGFTGALSLMTLGGLSPFLYFRF